MLCAHIKRNWFPFPFAWPLVCAGFTALAVFGYEAVLFPLSVLADYTLERAYGRLDAEFGGELPGRETLFEVGQEGCAELVQNALHLGKAGGLFQRGLVHVEAAVDLDLQGVLAAVGRAVVLSDEAACIGLVAQHAKPVATQFAFDEARNILRA